jgi:hypothetical protein
MESFNEFLKNELDDRNAKIPSSLSWESVGEHIIQGVKEDDRKPFPYWILLPMILFTLGAIFLYTQIKKEDNNAHVMEVEQAVPDYNISQSNNRTNGLITDHNIQENKLYDNISTQLAFDTLTSLKENPSGSTDRINKTPVSELDSPFETESLVAYEIGRIDNTENLKGSRDNKLSKISSQKEGIQKSADKNHKKVAALPGIPIQFSLLSTKNIPSPAFNESSFLTNKKRPFSFEMYGGINYWNQGYGNSDWSDLRSKMETTLISYQVGASMYYPLYKGFKLNSGFEYSRLEDRFNYRNTKQEQVLVQNVLKRIEINYVTGDSTMIHGDSLVNATITRTVVHYNRHHLLNIPVFITMEKRISPSLKITYGLGMNLNVGSRHSGRTVNADNQVIDYGISNPIYKVNLGAAAAANLGVFYQVSKTWDVGIQFRCSQYLNNWSRIEGFSLKPQLLQTNLVFRYHLNN